MQNSPTDDKFSIMPIDEPTQAAGRPKTLPLHLIKLCVGVGEISELAEWQKLRLKQNKRVFHVTRMIPRRSAEIVGSGSLYWVIKAKVAVRQRIFEIEPFTDEDGINRCRLIFDPKLVPVRPVPRRAFQGWRYLKDEDAPPDLSGSDVDAGLPAKMRNELVELGLL